MTGKNCIICKVRLLYLGFYSFIIPNPNLRENERRGYNTSRLCYNTFLSILCLHTF